MFLRSLSFSVLALATAAPCQTPIAADAVLFETGCGNMALTGIAPPVLGKSFEMVVNSRNNVAAFLALGFDRRDRSTAIFLGSVPNPFFPNTTTDCLLYTTPVAVVGLPIQRPFPGIGLSQVTIPVPDDNALLGLTFVAQAASVTPGGLLWVTPGVAATVGR